SKGSGPGSLAAIPAGERKIPEPMVEPTRTATELQRPSRRGNDDARANSESVRCASETSAARAGSAILYGSAKALSPRVALWARRTIPAAHSAHLTSRK